MSVGDVGRDEGLPKACDRVPVQGLGVLVRGDQRPATRQQPHCALSPAGVRSLRQSIHGRGGSLELAASRRRLDQVRKGQRAQVGEILLVDVARTLQRLGIAAEAELEEAIAEFACVMPAPCERMVQWGFISAAAARASDSRPRHVSRRRSPAPAGPTTPELPVAAAISRLSRRWVSAASSLPACTSYQPR